MRNRAAVFVTDKGFLVPSLVAARQLARSAASACADIIIFLIDIRPATSAKLESSFKQDKIIFMPLESRAFALAENVYFRPGHVPESALARLALADYIPSRYEHVVYLDGDVQIIGDISPLLAFNVPAGKIGAINGSIWLHAAADGSLPERHRKYLADLGDLQPRDYFNSGVLAFRRDSWAEIGPRALDYFYNNSEKCYHHDQSALNAVCKGRRLIIEPAYNFHSEYARLFPLTYKPNIVHFTGDTKPWKYPVIPWGQRYAKPYMRILEDYPYLCEFMSMPRKISSQWAFMRSSKAALRMAPQMNELLPQRARFLEYLRKEKFAF